MISAADPINVFGIITADPRIPATHRNALIVQAGQLLASRQAGHVEFYQPLDQATQWEMRRALALGRRRNAVADGPLLRRGRIGTPKLAHR